MSLEELLKYGDIDPSLLSKINDLQDTCQQHENEIEALEHRLNTIEKLCDQINNQYDDVMYHEGDYQDLAIYMHDCVDTIGDFYYHIEGYC